MLGAVPYLVGYHPADSLVVLGLRTKQLVFTARYDIPAPDAPSDEVATMINHMLTVVFRQDLTGVVLIGYGTDDRVRPLMLRLDALYTRGGLTVHEVLRTMDGRYWSYLCSDPSCCPLDGTPYDVAASAAAAAWTVAGRVVMPDRETYEQQVKPVDGPRRLAIGLATSKAGDRLMQLVAKPDRESDAEAIVARAGAEAIGHALARHRAGESLDDDEIAWLSVLLSSLTVRDMAWTAMEGPGEDIHTHQALWLDMMRHVEPDLIAAPGCLFAFASWRRGDGALARLAVEQVLAESPDYTMAHLLDHILAHGLPPSAFDGFLDTSATQPPAPRRRRRSSPRRAGSRST